NEAYLAAGPDDAVFDVVSQPAVHRLGHGRGPPLTVGGVEHFLNVTKAEAALLRRQPEDAIGFVRPGIAIRDEIALPVADVGDPLCGLQPALTLCEVAKHEDARQPVLQPPTDLLE